MCEMVDLGHTVVFSRKRSYAKNDETGQEVEFERVGGSWKLDMKVEPYADAKRVLDAADTSSSSSRHFGERRGDVP